MIHFSLFFALNADFIRIKFISKFSYYSSILGVTQKSHLTDIHSVIIIGMRGWSPCGVQRQLSKGQGKRQRTSLSQNNLLSMYDPYLFILCRWCKSKQSTIIQHSTPNDIFSLHIYHYETSNLIVSISIPSARSTQ